MFEEERRTLLDLQQAYLVQASLELELDGGSDERARGASDWPGLKSPKVDVGTGLQVEKGEHKEYLPVVSHALDMLQRTESGFYSTLTIKSKSNTNRSDRGDQVDRTCSDSSQLERGKSSNGNGNSNNYNNNGVLDVRYLPLNTFDPDSGSSDSTVSFPVGLGDRESSQLKSSSSPSNVFYQVCMSMYVYV